MQPSPRSSNSAAVSERYGDKASLLATFHVNHQSRHTVDPERCITGQAPTLTAVNEAYGGGTAEQWLMLQLMDFAEKAGARDKLTPGQVRELCDHFVRECGWLKLTDFELYFHRMKLGFYGKLFGCVDPAFIMEAYTKYLRERNLILAEIYEREDRKRRDHQFDGCMSIEEYRQQYPDSPDPLYELERMEEELARKKKEERERQKAEMRMAQEMTIERRNKSLDDYHRAYPEEQIKIIQKNEKISA